MKLKHDTQMYTRLADGPVRAITMPAGTPVTLLVTTNTPQGDVLLIEALDGSARANQVITLVEE